MEHGEHVDLKDRIQIFQTKSGRGWWICPTREAKEDPDIEDAIRQYFQGRMIFNPNRSCYVLPYHEGQQFYRDHSEVKEGKEGKIHVPPQEEENDLKIFPFHRDFYGGRGLRIAQRADQRTVPQRELRAQLEAKNKELEALQQRLERIADVIHR